MPVFMSIKCCLMSAACSASYFASSKSSWVSFSSRYMRDFDFDRSPSVLKLMSSFPIPMSSSYPCRSLSSFFISFLPSLSFASPRPGLGGSSANYTLRPPSCLRPPALLPNYCWASLAKAAALSALFETRDYEIEDAVSPSLILSSRFPLKVSISVVFFSFHSSDHLFNMPRASFRSSIVEY